MIVIIVTYFPTAGVCMQQVQPNSAHTRNYLSTENSICIHTPCIINGTRRKKAYYRDDIFIAIIALRY